METLIVLLGLASRCDGERLGAASLLNAGHTYTQTRREYCPACDSAIRQMSGPTVELDADGNEYVADVGPDPSDIHPEDCTCERDAETGARGFRGSEGELRSVEVTGIRAPVKCGACNLTAEEKALKRGALSHAGVLVHARRGETGHRERLAAWRRMERKVALETTCVCRGRGDQTDSRLRYAAALESHAEERAEIAALDEWIKVHRVPGERPMREAGGRP